MELTPSLLMIFMGKFLNASTISSLYRLGTLSSRVWYWPFQPRALYNPSATTDNTNAKEKYNTSATTNHTYKREKQRANGYNRDRQYQRKFRWSLHCQRGTPSIPHALSKWNNGGEYIKCQPCSRKFSVGVDIMCKYSYTHQTSRLRWFIL